MLNTQFNPTFTNFVYPGKSKTMKFLDFCNGGLYPIVGQKIVVSVIRSRSKLANKKIRKCHEENFRIGILSKIFLGFISIIALPIIGITLTCKYFSKENAVIYAKVINFVRSSPGYKEPPPKIPLLKRPFVYMYRKNPKVYSIVHAFIFKYSMFALTSYFKHCVAALIGQPGLLQYVEEEKKIRNFLDTGTIKLDPEKVYLKLGKVAFELLSNYA